MDSAQTAFLRDVLSGTPWLGDCRRFARVLRTAPRSDGGLLLVGTPEEEPWHLAAHLDAEAELSGLSVLSPTLVRHAVPLGAAPHLAVGLDRLTSARNGEAVLVIAPDAPGERLLDRVDDARRRGAAILAVADTDADGPGGAGRAGSGELGDLLGLAHDVLSVPTDGPVPGFDSAQHLLAVAAGERMPSQRGFRDRLTRALDRIAGPGVTEW